MRSKIYSVFFFTMIALLTVFKLNAQQLQSKTLIQIRNLINEKATRTPAEKKISSGLLQAVREKNNQLMAQGVQLKKANINVDNFNNLKVDISGDITDDLLTKIQNLGGKIIYPSAEYHTLRALISLDKVKTIAGFEEVKFIEPAVESKVVDNNIPYSSKNKRTNKIEDNLRNRLISYLQKTGFNKLSGKAANNPVTSEGDRTHRADDARNTYGYSGEGIKIGVLSNSYNATGGETQDILNGDLPGKNNPFGDTVAVTVVQDDPDGSDEGRAMLHIIHDLAPKAQLFFATADVSEADFANKIKILRSVYHCNIIIDDVEYLDEPPFQDGIVAQAVNTVTANGAMYFASAGNAGSLEKNTSAVYEGDFNDIGSPADTLDSKHGSIHNFGTQAAPITGNIVLNAGSNSRYYLEWADPLGKSSNDYDLFLVDKNGAVVGLSTNIQNGTQNPVERISANVTAGDKLVVFKDSAASKRAFHLNAGFASEGAKGLTIGTNGQTFGHNAAVNAFSVAATPATFPGPYPNAFDATNKVEDFSSDGPRRIFYNADTTPVTTGNFLFSTGGGLIRKKPDVTAADGVSTQTSSASFDPFYGTSAAAPHAGAIAALLKSANPDLTPSEIRSLLTSTALDIETTGYDSISGYGILQAFQAMQKLNPTPTAVINLDTSYAIDGSGSNHNGFIEPGETANFIVGLSNNSLKAATNVSAKITTSDTGVTILSDSSFYGTVNTGGGLVFNTGKPLIFKTSNSFVCGSTIHFITTVAYTGGKSATKSFESSVDIGNQPYRNIATTLGSPVSNTIYTVSTGKQKGRLGRYLSIGSVCGSLITNPGVSAAAGNGLRTYDAYTFTNNTSVNQCVAVTLNTNNYDSLYSVAYSDSGFVPSSPATHFIAEPQLTSGPFTYSFDVAAGKAFTVVVNEVDSVVSTGRPYTLNVSLRKCTQNVLAVNVFNLFTQADQAKRQIPLHWIVANDQQTRFYEIQRSTDGIHFNSLQTVASALSATQKTYNYIDKTPGYGDNYYRIKKVDLNGVISYSNIAKASLQLLNDIVLMPNPASTYINLFSKTNMGQVQLFDSKGQLLQTVKPQSSFYKLETGKLAAGQYFIRIQTNNGIVNEKFIKQ